MQTPFSFSFAFARTSSRVNMFEDILAPLPTGMILLRELLKLNMNLGI